MSYQSKHTGTAIDNAITDMQSLQSIILNTVYPVGSLYTSFNSTSPANIVGGTWEQITDRMIMAAGSTYTVGTTGGATSHTHTSAAHTHTSAAHTHTTAGHALTVNEMPSHTHPIYQDPNFCAYHTGNNNSWKQGLVNVEYPQGNYYTNQNQPFAGGGASHSHGNTGSTTPGNTGSTTPGNTGSSSNLPPYIVAYIWRRTA